MKREKFFFLYCLMAVLVFLLVGCGAGGGGGTGGGSNPPTNPPSITNVSPASVKVGDTVTIDGNNFGVTRAPSTVSINGALVGTYSSWSNTQIKVIVPNLTPASVNASVVVSTSGGSSNAFSITVNPFITSLNPNTGSGGDEVTITGTSFGNSQGTSRVTFTGTNANIINWSNSAIRAQVPNGISSGNVVVTVAGIASNGVAFTIGQPHIDNLLPTSGIVGTAVTINGTNFGSIQGSGAISFNGTAATASSWSNTQIQTVVPTNATTGNVTVTTAAGTSNGVTFTITGPLSYLFNKRVAGLSAPYKISFDSVTSNIYLTNFPNITELDENLNIINNFSCPSGCAGMGEVTVSSQYVYFSDGQSQVWRMDKDGNNAAKFVDCTRTPQDVSAEYGNYIAVLETSNGVDGWVQVFGTNGVSVYNWQITGANTPESIALCPDGTIRIADTQNDRILHYSLSGTLLGSFGSTGAGEGQFDSPSDIYVTPIGYMYIIDRNSHRFQVFNGVDQFLGQYQGTFGDGDGQFNYACGIAVDNTGNVCCSNFSGLNIQKFVLNP